MEIPRASAEVVLGLELARLDELQSGIYTNAAEGDQNAIQTVLKIMAHRAMLEGITKPVTTNINAQITGADGTPLIPASPLLPLVNFIFTDRPLPNEGMAMPAVEPPKEEAKEEEKSGGGPTNGSAA